MLVALEQRSRGLSGASSARSWLSSVFYAAFIFFVIVGLSYLIKFAADYQLRR
jgi:hypothetical protein